MTKLVELEVPAQVKMIPNGVLVHFSSAQVPDPALGERYRRILNALYFNAGGALSECSVI